MSDGATTTGERREQGVKSILSLCLCILSSKFDSCQLEKKTLSLKEEGKKSGGEFLPFAGTSPVL